MGLPWLLCCCAVLGVGGNLALRAGMAGFAPDKGQAPMVGIVIRLLTSPILWIGLLAYAASMILWLSVLARSPLSAVYPIFVSISFLLLLTCSVAFLHEPLSWPKVVGASIILVGIWMCMRAP